MLEIGKTYKVKTRRQLENCPYVYFEDEYFRHKGGPAYNSFVESMFNCKYITIKEIRENYEDEPIDYLAEGNHWVWLEWMLDLEQPKGLEIE